jgi:hypothetical protein
LPLFLFNNPVLNILLSSLYVYLMTYIGNRNINKDIFKLREGGNNIL